jgi:protein involved in polysaccharide export with SLBB domain
MSHKLRETSRVPIASGVTGEMSDGLRPPDCIMAFGRTLIGMKVVRPGVWLGTSVLLVILVLCDSARAQTVVETPQQTNDRIRSMSAAARSTPHDYVIGNGDVVSIQIFDVPDLNRDVRVSQTGTIGIPLIPVRVYVAGLTELQTEQKIAELLEANGLVSHPEVSVSVKERKSKPITIVGAVSHPMVLEADRPISLLEALAEAGGIAPDAGDTVLVTRPDTSAATDPNEPPSLGPEDPVAGEPTHSAKNLNAAPSAESSANAAAKQPAKATVASPEALPAANAIAADEPPPLNNMLTVNLNELLESGDARNNVLLQAGDVVTVPHAGIVYALGAVNRPGGFVLANDRAQMTTLKILALAGGLTHTAKFSGAVIIRKDSQGKQTEVHLDLKKVLKREAEDVQLRPSDILLVPDSGARQALLKALEIGGAVGTSVLLYRVALK